MRNLHNLGLFSSMGGPFDRVFFELYVVGDEVQPAMIDDFVGIESTSCYLKGDERPKGNQYRKTGGWFFKSGEINLGEEEFEDSHFLSWLQKIPSYKKWESFDLDFDVGIRLVGYTHQWNSDFKLTAAVLTELSRIGLELSVEPFLSLEDED